MPPNLYVSTVFTGTAVLGSILDRPPYGVRRQKRSGDGAFVDSAPPAYSKAASRFACRRHSIYFADGSSWWYSQIPPRWLASFPALTGLRTATIIRMFTEALMSGDSASNSPAMKKASSHRDCHRGCRIDWRSCDRLRLPRTYITDLSWSISLCEPSSN